MKISNSVVNLLLTPIKEQNPIMAREEDLNKFPVKLNRHRILHGIDIDYGSEKNSFRCLSFVKYLSDLLQTIK